MERFKVVFMYTNNGHHHTEVWDEAIFSPGWVNVKRHDGSHRVYPEHQIQYVEKVVEEPPAEIRRTWNDLAV